VIFQAIEDFNSPETKEPRQYVENEMSKPAPKGFPRMGEFYCGTIPPLSYGVSEEVPCFSSAVSVEYSKELGRHLVATRDCEIG
jgi:hypothetical protein